LNNERIEVPLVPECSACIINSLRLLIPILTDSKEEQFKLFSLAYEQLAEGYAKNIEPAPLSIELYRKLYSETGKFDPYSEIKHQSTVAAQKVVPIIERHINELEGYERLRAALSSGITGNLIDFNTAGHNPDLSLLEEMYHTISKEGFAIDDSEHLWRSLKSRTGNVVYLADNAGETLFDIPLLRFLKELGWNTTYVVKGKPMINDAVRVDVETTEIPKLAEIADTGAWAHGVPRQWVSNEFLEIVAQGDLVISKGQANIETFPEIQREISIETYYVTRAKCPHISQSIGAKKGDNVVLRRPSVN